MSQRIRMQWLSAMHPWLVSMQMTMTCSMESLRLPSARWNVDTSTRQFTKAIYMQRTIEPNPFPNPVTSAELTRQALCVNPKQGPLSNPLRGSR